MKSIHQYRVKTSDQGTFSFVMTFGFMCWCLELPWKENNANVSCIPAGKYIVKLRRSPKFGLTFHLTDVTDRTFILQHSGNYAGDKSKGFKTHTYGCQLFGKKRGTLHGQTAILNSRLTIKRFMKFMDHKPYKLTIHNICSSLG